MIRLDYGDRRPIYEQIKEKLKTLIISGALKENEKIPSVRELAVTMAINPNTIQKAYKELEGDGYIYSLRAKGYFVASVENSAFTGQIKLLLDKIGDSTRELFFLGVPKEKVMASVDNIYNGGNGNDKS